MDKLKELQQEYARKMKHVALKEAGIEDVSRYERYITDSQDMNEINREVSELVNDIKGHVTTSKRDKYKPF